MLERKTKDYILDVFDDVFREKGSIPTFNDLYEKGITRRNVRTHFGTLQDLTDYYLRDNDVRESEESEFNEEKQEYLAKTESELLISSIRKKVIDSFLNYIKENNAFPRRDDLYADVSDTDIAKTFGNFTKLKEHISNSEIFLPFLKQNIVNSTTVFNQKRFDELSDTLKRYDKFFVTTAVVDKKVDEKALASVKNWCEKNNACLLILPIMDVASRSRHKEWNLDIKLRDENIVFSDVKLNDNLHINTIKLSAKQINPLTGLSRIGQRNGTFIYAAPKQFLEYVATSNLSYPHAIMTTGAITVPDYNTDLYMSERTSYIAESDHIMGGIIVEIENDRIFHFRQTQFDNTGAFYDLGTTYHPTGVISSTNKNSLVLGDMHVGNHDEDNFESVLKLMDEIPIKDLYLHDFFDGYSISHHDLGQPLKRASKAINSNLSLANELKRGLEVIDIFLKNIDEDIYMVKSNHDEVLERYLREGRYVNDPENHYFALDLARAMIEGRDPLEYAYMELDVNHWIDWDRVHFLKRDETLKIAGIEMAAHGDLGANGSKGSLNTLEKAYGNCIVGHAHSAAISRGVWRVGTSSKLRLDYSKGPSSWTHTHAMIDEETGTRQLINHVNGKFYLRG